MRGKSESRNTVSMGAADRASVRSHWRFASTLSTASHGVLQSALRRGLDLPIDSTVFCLRGAAFRFFHGVGGGFSAGLRI